MVDSLLISFCLFTVSYSLCIMGLCVVGTGTRKLTRSGPPGVTECGLAAASRMCKHSSWSRRSEKESLATDLSCVCVRIQQVAVAHRRLLFRQLKSAAALPHIAAYSAAAPSTKAKPLLRQAPRITASPQRPQLRSTSRPPGRGGAVMQPVRLSSLPQVQPNLGTSTSSPARQPTRLHRPTNLRGRVEFA